METFAKDCIIEGFFLLLEKEDFEKISITEICSKAGVSRLSYYRIFSSKDDIIKAFFKSKENQFRINNHLFINQGNDVEYTIEAVFQGIKDNQKQFDLILKQHLEHLYLDYLNEAFVKAFKSMKYEVSELTPYIYAGMLFNTTLSWAKNNYEQPVKEIADILTKAILN